MKGCKMKTRETKRQLAFTCFDNLKEMAKSIIEEKIALTAPSPVFPPGLSVLMYVSVMHRLECFMML